MLAAGTLSWEDFGPLELGIPLHVVSTDDELPVDLADVEARSRQATIASTPKAQRRQGASTGCPDLAADGVVALSVVYFAMDGYVAELARRGLVSGAVETVNKGVQLSAIRDPDGNTIHS